MCGRTACTLDPHQLRQACAYNNRRGHIRKPRWRTKKQGGGGSKDGSKTKNNDGISDTSGRKALRYFPSYNIAPQAATPVLVSSKHFGEEQGDPEEERTLTLMKWGLVPSWHKGDPAAVAYKMNNCRSEGMMDKVSFKKPFQKGQRCVVLADGYYEWHTDSNKKKQPYFIYFSQDERVSELGLPESYEFDYERANVESTEEPGKEWTGHRLLTMAGIFDVWRPTDGSEPLYTYSVITIGAASSVGWIHHRMPVFLDGDEAVRDWLDFGGVPAEKALTMLKPLDCLSCHPVTPQMGNIRYKQPDCIKKIDPEAKKEPKNTFMTSWLKKGTTTTTVKTAPSLKPKVEVKVERGTDKNETGLTAWLKKANKPETLKRAMESSFPHKNGSPSKVHKKMEQNVKMEK